MIEFTMHNSFLTDEVVAEFSGFDVLMYYWYMIKTFMSQYSWQVRTSYTIVVLCIITKSKCDASQIQMRSLQGETKCVSFLAHTKTGLGVPGPVLHIA